MIVSTGIIDVNNKHLESGSLFIAIPFKDIGLKTGSLELTR